MAEFTPQIVPLGGLADAATAGADLAQQEAQALGYDTGEPGTLTGAVGPEIPIFP